VCDSVCDCTRSNPSNPQRLYPHPPSQEGRRPNSPTASCQSANTQESAGGGWNGRGGGAAAANKGPSPGGAAPGSAGAHAAAAAGGGGGATTAARRGIQLRQTGALSADSGVDEILASGHEHLPAGPADCFSDLDRELQRLIRLDWVGGGGSSAAAEVGSSAGTPGRRIIKVVRGSGGGGGGPKSKASNGTGARHVPKGQRPQLKPEPGGGCARLGLPAARTASASVGGPVAAAAAAPVAVARPKVVIKLPKSLLARAGSSGAAAPGGGGGGGGQGGAAAAAAAAAAAGLGAHDAGVQKRLTLKLSSPAAAGRPGP
jgi:hypothetical protein